MASETAVAIAIAKSRSAAVQAARQREEAAESKLRRLKGGMAVLVRVLRKRADTDSSCAVLDSLLAALASEPGASAQQAGGEAAGVAGASQPFSLAQIAGIPQASVPAGAAQAQQEAQACAQFDLPEPHILQARTGAHLVSWLLGSRGIA